MTDARDDEKIAALLESGGHASYGLWWLILEVIAQHMTRNSPKCSVTYPLQKWAALLGIRPQNLRRQLAPLVRVGLLEMRERVASGLPDKASTTAGIELCVPNLLKYRDEYSQRSGYSPDSDPTKQQRQTQTRDSEKTTTEPAPLPHKLIDGLRRLIPGIDHGAVRRIWNDCQREAPDAAPNEILRFADQTLSKARHIESPAGLLIKTLPERLKQELSRYRQEEKEMEDKRQQAAQEQAERQRVVEAADRDAERRLAELPKAKFEALGKEQEAKLLHDDPRAKGWSTEDRQKKIMSMMKASLAAHVDQVNA